MDEKKTKMIKRVNTKGLLDKYKVKGMDSVLNGDYMYLGYKPGSASKIKIYMDEDIEQIQFKEQYKKGNGGTGEIELIGRRWEHNTCYFVHRLCVFFFYCL